MAGRRQKKNSELKGKSDQCESSFSLAPEGIGGPKKSKRRGNESTSGKLGLLAASASDAADRRSLSSSAKERESVHVIAKTHHRAAQVESSHSSTKCR